MFEFPQESWKILMIVAGYTKHEIVLDILKGKVTLSPYSDIYILSSEIL